MLMGYPLFILGDLSINITKAAHAKIHIPNEHCLPKSSLSSRDTAGNTGLAAQPCSQCWRQSTEARVLMFVSLRQQSQSFLKNTFAIFQIKPLLICAGITFGLGDAASCWWYNLGWFACTLLTPNKLYSLGWKWSMHLRLLLSHGRTVHLWDSSASDRWSTVTVSIITGKNETKAASL